MALLVKSDEVKRGHVCPPSNATHPENRWETAFVYSFICKFTKLRQEVDGLETAMDLEDALLFIGPHPILEQILARFVLNIRPQTRNIGHEVISSTVASLFAEHMAKGERTTFWDEKRKINADPFGGKDPNGFFEMPWDTKLCILRQLVEWQLTYGPEIKGIIERGWGVVHMKHKKSNTEIVHETQRLQDNDPYSKSSLSMLPLGQDSNKKRYWAVDASPRLYVSTNPWKVTATFEKVSTTKEEYLQVVEDLKKNSPPPPKSGEKRPKAESAHLALIKILEERIASIDHEIQRVARVRKKLLQKELAAAQILEIRGPRTRRSTQRPDYVYHNGEDEEEEDDFIDDDYKMEDEADFINDDDLSDDAYDDGFYERPRRPRRAAAVAGTERRRSTRTSAAKTNGNRDPQSEWRGERRSTRLGAPMEQQLDYVSSAKRSRTSASATSSVNEESMEVDPELQQKKSPSLLPNENALPLPARKKVSKFWYYAVEPIPGAAQATTMQMDDNPIAGPSGLNGNQEINQSISASETQLIGKGPHLENP